MSHNIAFSIIVAGVLHFPHIGLPLSLFIYKRFFFFHLNVKPFSTRFRFFFLLQFPLLDFHSLTVRFRTKKCVFIFYLFKMNGALCVCVYCVVYH